MAVAAFFALPQRLQCDCASTGRCLTALTTVGVLQFSQSVANHSKLKNALPVSHSQLQLASPVYET